MASIHINHPTWNQACTSLGWQGPNADSLWEHLGGGQAQDLTWEMVYRTIMSVGWTGEHAEVLWKTLAAHTAPVPPAPETVTVPEPETPAEQIVEVVGRSDALPAPWERNVALEEPLMETTEGRPKKAKKEKAAKTAKPRKDKDPLDLGLAPKRLAAAAVDGVIIAALGYLATMVAGVKLGVLLGTTKGDPIDSLKAGVAMTLLAGLYFMFTMRRDSNPGQSLGKQLMQLAVVRQDGGVLDLETVLKREVLGVVFIPWLAMWGINSYLMAPIGFGALAILLLVTLRGRGVQDMLAATDVQEA